MAQPQPKALRDDFELVLRELSSLEPSLLWPDPREVCDDSELEREFLQMERLFQKQGYLSGTSEWPARSRRVLAAVKCAQNLSRVETVVPGPQIQPPRLWRRLGRLRLQVVARAQRLPGMGIRRRLFSGVFSGVF